MRNGDILAELRAWRDEFARQHDYDVGAMTAVLRKLDRTAGMKVIRGEPRRPVAELPQGMSTPNEPLQPTAAP